MGSLGDGVKKVLLAGIGTAAVTAEKSKEVLDKMAERGEAAVEQGKVLNQELKHNAKKKVKEAIDETAKVRDKNGYTTIGYALQAAEDVLKKNKATKGNGCVVLMSDGRQYYLKNGQRGSEAQEARL